VVSGSIWTTCGKKLDAVKGELRGRHDRERFIEPELVELHLDRDFLQAEGGEEPGIGGSSIVVLADALSLGSSARNQRRAWVSSRSFMSCLGHPGHRRTGPGRALPDDGHGNEPSHWPVVLGDGHALARGETVDEFRQVGLCFRRVIVDIPQSPKVRGRH